MPRQIKAADLFCGAGGTSTGLAHACAAIGADLDLLAVNHWDLAIETHSANHPGARHLCESLDNVDPRKVVPGGRLNVLLASPECTHHSNARGGKPMSDQSRASAWHILRWAEALYIDNILVENVREFETWGPLGANGRPLASKRGQTFQAFLDSLRSLGYAVDYRVLNAADYGDATTRERLFVKARRGNRKVTWPEPTHAPGGAKQPGLFENRKQWRAAREIIDWTLPGQSIFTRKKPLAPATMERIAAGLRKFGGRNAEPFLVVLRNNQNARSLDLPVPTMTTSGANFALCEPFLVGAGGPTGSGRTPRSVNDPLGTVMTENHTALVQPFILPLNRTKDQPRSVDDPLRTVTATSNDMGLVEPFIVPFFGERDGQSPRCHSIEDPLPTVTGHGAGALVQPFIVRANHGTDRRSPDGGHARRSHPIDAPMPTITGVNSFALVEPFLVEYYGTGESRPVDEPLATVTTKDRFGLVEVDGLHIDIRFRMLQPHELAAAMGFPPDYHFAGSRESKVKQIGNAVCKHLAQALCLEMIA